MHSRCAQGTKQCRCISLFIGTIYQLDVAKLKGLVTLQYHHLGLSLHAQYACS